MQATADAELGACEQKRDELAALVAKLEHELRETQRRRVSEHGSWREEERGGGGVVILKRVEKGQYMNE